MKIQSKNSDAEQVTLKMWCEGVKRIKRILSVHIKSIQPEVFKDSVVNQEVLDISALQPRAAVQVVFIEKWNTIKRVTRYFSKTMLTQIFDPTRSGFHLSDACKESKHLVKSPQEILMNRLESSFDVAEISLLDTVTDNDYVYTKINHACWEEITKIGLKESEKEYIRRIDPVDWDCVNSGFYECLAVCLSTSARAMTIESEINEGILLRNKNFSFGIGLTGGNASFKDDFHGQGRDAKIIKDIYSAVTIGTASGLIGFFSSLVEGEHKWLVVDGSAPKILFWNGQFGKFIKSIMNSSDAILFIVPPSLSGIKVADKFGVKVFKLIVPEENIDTLWGTVVPVALQHIAEISEKYRLTVLSQCSVVSAIIGMMTSLHLKDSKHCGPCRFYDLGQLLDLMNVDGAETGFWLSRKDVRNHIKKTNNWSDLL